MGIEPKKNVWDGFVSADEQERYRAAGFGKSLGTGKRPALLIIDVQYRTLGSRRVPFWEAIKEYKTACGEEGWAAVERIEPLLKLFRSKNWPVLYPFVSVKESYDSGRLGEKTPTLMMSDQKGYEFATQIAPHPREILVPKKHPSAFFGTPLLSYLIDLGVDTLVITGCSTSGCVRSTTVDAFAYNFKVLLPHECVYDRSAVVHAVNLFDMASKYADVLTNDVLLSGLAALPEGDFKR